MSVYGPPPSTRPRQWHRQGKEATSWGGVFSQRQIAAPPHLHVPQPPRPSLRAPAADEHVLGGDDSCVVLTCFWRGAHLHGETMTLCVVWTPACHHAVWERSRNTISRNTTQQPPHPHKHPHIVAHPATPAHPSALTCTGSAVHASFSNSRKYTSFSARVPSKPPNRYSRRPSSVAHREQPVCVCVCVCVRVCSAQGAAQGRNIVFEHLGRGQQGHTVQYSSSCRATGTTTSLARFPCQIPNPHLSVVWEGCQSRSRSSM